MLTVRLEGEEGTELDIDEGNYVWMEGNDARPKVMFANWEEIPRDTQSRILDLRDTIRINTQALVDLMTSELGRFIECPSEVPCSG